MRRGSVLVLVMTLLGILFVVGVAFLATMNFEADMISAERTRTLSESGVDAAVADAGTILGNAIMAGPGIPFGDSSAALSGASFAEMPGVQNSFSPIEPIRRVGADNIPFTPDDSVVFNGYFDAQAHVPGSATKPSQIPAFYVDTAARNGSQVIAYTVQIPGATPGAPPVEHTVNLLRCTDGPLKGQACTVAADCQTTPGPAMYSCEGQQLADADGDGIVDSLLVDAKEMGLSDAQLADLASKVNPASNLAGKVKIAIRVVPHGGMVSLNESHPTMIRTVFDIPSTLWPLPTDPAVDPDLRFRHGPTQDLRAYSPMLEESLLRRRGMIPPRDFSPSLLHGSPLAANPQSTGAHMPRQLFWWSSSSGQQDVFSSASATAKGHRFTPFEPTELYPDEPNFYYWPVMMDPTTANKSAAAPPPWNPGGTDLAYDRRHLVTTIDHGDLFARAATVITSRGEVDLSEAMREANQFAPKYNDPNYGESTVAFEYPYYPSTGLENSVCHKEDVDCVLKRNQGRLQLSFPWIDAELEAAKSTSLSPAERYAYMTRIHRIIHDVFYMLVRNAAQPSEVEGMSCYSDDDCPFADTVCLRDAAGPPTPPGRFGPNEPGTCVHVLHVQNATAASFSNTNPALPSGCLAVPCSVAGSTCRDDGVCELAAAAWRDVECPTYACGAGEFCQSRCQGGANSGEFCVGAADCPGGTCGPAGLCSDLWTRQPRGQAMVSRTAASLTANMIDYVDTDNKPTRIALRNFDFSRPYRAGHEVDANTNVGLKVPCTSDVPCAANGLVCSVLSDPQTGNRMCIKPVYVYGLEEQPYLTEVATLNDPGTLDLVARGVEIMNPYDLDAPATGYYLYEVNPADGTTNEIPLNGIFRGTLSAAGPFTTFYSENPSGNAVTLFNPLPVPGAPYELSGPNELEFENGWFIYLVRRVDYSDEFTNPVVVNIVVDQMLVQGDGANLIGQDAGALTGISVPPDIRFSLERVVNPNSHWTAPIPIRKEGPQGHASLNTWNTTAVDQSLYPVELQLANTGWFGISANTSNLPAFPTTGSLLAIMRHANRSMDDLVSPLGRVDALAYTSNLVGGPSMTVPYRDPPGSGTLLTSPEIDFAVEHEIDNGRLPIFDVGQIPGAVASAGIHGMHHLSPTLFKAWDPLAAYPAGTDKGIPGGLNMLPWGQLVFDYFTALPLSNGGPYDIDPAGNYLSLPEVPRVDREGLRVHGRLNLNAAPWKAISGLPFVPMNVAAGSQFTVSFQGLPTSYQTKITDVASGEVVGPELAQAIVAYRDARTINDDSGTTLTGNYSVSGQVMTSGRGWTNPIPSFRRGTGFMSVGELANVRHLGAAATAVPPGSPYRIDSGEIGSDPGGNKNNEDFIRAAAVLIALGDWVSVRSHVFTVYGQIRGADDPDVAALYPPNSPAQIDALIRDTDSRAIRFQETIDRFPILEGRARPQRIGERTVGSYTDVNND